VNRTSFTTFQQVLLAQNPSTRDQPTGSGEGTSREIVYFASASEIAPKKIFASWPRGQELGSNRKTFKG
jgi:hypothetical protein